MATKFYNGIDLQSQKAVNMADPSGPSDAATKQYVDNVISGLSWKAPVKAASTTNLTQSGTQTVDGVTLIAGDRVLCKDQTTASTNGIWVVASGAWTRATDMDVAAETLNATAYVSQGTVNGSKSFTQTATSVTLGTTNLVFVQVGGGTAYTAGNGLQLSTTTFSVLANGTSIDVSASGIKIADAAGGNGCTVTSGIINVGAGTGITVGADTVGVDTTVIPKKFATTVGDGTSTTLTVTHNLGTQDITYSIRNASTNEFVYTDAVANGVNTLQLTFASAPASGAYRVVVHG